MIKGDETAISNCTFFRFEISSLQKSGFFVLIDLESLSKNRTIVKFTHTMGGFEIFKNRTIVKSTDRNRTVRGPLYTGNKVIIEKYRGERSLMEQDTIENVS